MPRVLGSLRRVRTKCCAKPDCVNFTSLQRHHKRHQAMWLGIWASTRRGEPRFEAFVERYWEFRGEDCVLLCGRHHPEIHDIYDQVIQEHLIETDKRLYRYTWTEANDLMDKLELACMSWLQRRTPGLDPKVYARKKRKRKARKK